MGFCWLVFLVYTLSGPYFKKYSIFKEILKSIDSQQMKDRMLEPYPSHHEFTSAVIIGHEFLELIDEGSHLQIEIPRNLGVLTGVSALFLLHLVEIDAVVLGLGHGFEIGAAAVLRRLLRDRLLLLRAPIH